MQFHFPILPAFQKSSYANDLRRNDSNASARSVSPPDLTQSSQPLQSDSVTATPCSQSSQTLDGSWPSSQASLYSSSNTSTGVFCSSSCSSSFNNQSQPPPTKASLAAYLSRKNEPSGRGPTGAVGSLLEPSSLPILPNSRDGVSVYNSSQPSAYGHGSAAAGLGQVARGFLSQPDHASASRHGGAGGNKTSSLMMGWQGAKNANCAIEAFSKTQQFHNALEENTAAIKNLTEISTRAFNSLSEMIKEFFKAESEKKHQYECLPETLLRNAQRTEQVLHQLVEENRNRAIRDAKSIEIEATGVLSLSTSIQILQEKMTQILDQLRSFKEYTTTSIQDQIPRFSSVVKEQTDLLVKAFSEELSQSRLQRDDSRTCRVADSSEGLVAAERRSLDDLGEKECLSFSGGPTGPTDRQKELEGGGRDRDRALIGEEQGGSTRSERDDCAPDALGEQDGRAQDEQGDSTLDAEGGQDDVAQGVQDSSDPSGRGDCEMDAQGGRDGVASSTMGDSSVQVEQDADKSECVSDSKSSVIGANEFSNGACPLADKESRNSDLLDGCKADGRCSRECASSPESTSSAGAVIRGKDGIGVKRFRAGAVFSRRCKKQASCVEVKNWLGDSEEIDVFGEPSKEDSVLTTRHFEEGYISCSLEEENESSSMCKVDDFVQFLCSRSPSRMLERFESPDPLGGEKRCRKGLAGSSELTCGPGSEGVDPGFEMQFGFRPQGAEQGALRKGDHSPRSLRRSKRGAQSREDDAGKRGSKEEPSL